MEKKADSTDLKNDLQTTKEALEASNKNLAETKAATQQRIPKDPWNSFSSDAARVCQNTPPMTAQNPHCP